MKCITEVLEQIEQSAATKNDTETRFIKKIDLNQVVRQGDIYIHKVATDWKVGKPVSNQLAMGSTKGSRHFAESPAKCYEGVDAPQYMTNTLLGPVIQSTDRFTISHPEHAHISLPAGTYAVTHQMDARTLRRVQD
jgi:hypothetical protein